MFPKDTRILIVDDSAAIREQIRQELNRMGFSALAEASSADGAVVALSEHLARKTPFGLVISDWQMPGTSGLDFLKVLRAMPEYEKLPFIMLTTEAEPGQVLDAAGAGVSSYIVKPLAPRVLEQKLAAVWKKHHGG